MEVNYREIWYELIQWVVDKSVAITYTEAYTNVVHKADRLFYEATHDTSIPWCLQNGTPTTEIDYGVIWDKLIKWVIEERYITEGVHQDAYYAVLQKAAKLLAGNYRRHIGDDNQILL